MCYVLLLSTTSGSDLSRRSTDLVVFDRELPDIADAGKLRHANRWYVGSRHGCSCGFRHLYSIELGFGEPVDWAPEEDDDVAATLQLIAIIRELVEGGYRLDCIDAWHHTGNEPVANHELEVDLSSVSDRAFRLFENHHFEFRKGVKTSAPAPT